MVNFCPNKLILKSDCSDLIKFGGTEMVTLKDSNGDPETDRRDNEEEMEAGNN